MMSQFKEKLMKIIDTFYLFPCIPAVIPFPPNPQQEAVLHAADAHPAVDREW